MLRLRLGIEKSHYSSTILATINQERASESRQENRSSVEVVSTRKAATTDINSNVVNDTTISKTIDLSIFIY
jgi:hypothetical protein